jgi:hypothetical protein
MEEFVMSGCAKLIASACLAASASWFAGSAGAAPAQPGQLLQGSAALPIEQVQMRGRGSGGRGGVSMGRSSGPSFSGRTGGSNWSARGPGSRWSAARGSGTRWSGSNWNGRHWAGGWRGHRGRWWGPGLALGVGVPFYGAYGYYDDYAYDPYGYDDNYVVVAPGEDDDAAAYCSRRFRSYDPNTGTYLGYDGLRHPCP